MTPGGVQRCLGVPVQHVPTYLALTEGRKYGLASSDGAQPTLTTREARRLVELHGALRGIYQHLSTMKSPALRKKLAENQKAFEQRYSDNTTPPEASARFPGSLAWNLDEKVGRTLLRERGFYSLIRMLTPADTRDQPQEYTNDRIRSSRSYQAVLNCREFNELQERIAVSNVCAIDTETDGKDPRTVTLFGISLLKLERDGTPVDGARLEQLRSRLVDGMLELKKHVSDGIGSEIDLDSQKEISILMTEKLGLGELLGRKSLTQSSIEQFAPQQPLLKLVVEYKRRVSLCRRCKSARVAARVRRTRRPAPILRWFLEFEHGEAEHGTGTCLSMVTAVLSVGRVTPVCRADGLIISASIRSRNLFDVRDQPAHLHI
jgi:hypothetical protein